MASNNIDDLPSHNNKREHPKDKSSLVMLAVVIIFVAASGVLVMGLAPEIFRQGDTLDAQKHEDDARASQTIEIVNETNASLKNLEERMHMFIIESENRSSRGAAERQLIIEEMQGVVNKLDANSGQSSKILASLANKSKDHERQSNQMKILANSINSSLEAYGENSIKQFLSILDNQDKIFELLNNTDVDMDGNITIIDDGRD